MKDKYNQEFKTFKLGEDKAPAGGHGFKDATYEYDPTNDKRFGIACDEFVTTEGKKAQLVVIDIDKRGIGFYVWEHLLSNKIFSKEDLNTLTVRSQNGGLHIYYYFDYLDFNFPKQLKQNIDIKSSGGYIVAWGSEGKNGTYTIIKDAPIKKLPESVFKYITTAVKEGTTSDTPFNDGFVLSEEEKEKILDGLEKNFKHWDTSYDERYRVLGLMKSVGFSFDDWKKLISKSTGSNQTMDKWESDWGYSDGEYMAAKAFSLTRVARVAIDGLTKDTMGTLRPYTKVKTKKLAYKVAEKMFKDRYVKVRVKSQVYIYDIKIGDILKVEAFHSEHFRYNIEVEEDKKTYKASKLYEERMVEFKGLVFRPDIEERTIEENGDLFVNTFTPLALEIEHNYDESKFSKISDYILNVMADGRLEIAEMIHTFIAKTVLNPADRENAFALAAYSPEEGTGKSFFGRFVHSLLGGDYGYGTVIQSVSSLNIENNLINGKLFVYIDESAGNWNNADTNMMKYLITEPHFQIKQKYVSNFIVNNYTHWYFNTNDSRVANIGLDDRRFLVVQVSNIHQRDKKYFGELKAEMENEEAIKNYLGYIWQFKDVEVELPDNRERREQKIASLGPEDTWLYTMLEEENFDWNIYSHPQYEDGEIENVGILYDFYRAFFQEYYPPTQYMKGRNMFAAHLRNRKFLVGERQQKKVDGKNYKYYKILTKDELQKLFDDKLLNSNKE